VSGEGWYLLGDAAGLVDPITREGIYFALQSAQYAADAVIDGSGRASRHYADRIRSEIVSDLAHAARLKAAFFDPRFSRLLVAALARSEAIRAVMGDLIAGTQSYRTLSWRLVKTMEVGVAWRLLRSMWSARSRS
jgi:flavin-dependent dehydrogenase